jgi:hypothetical protein
MAQGTIPIKEWVRALREDSCSLETGNKANGNVFAAMIRFAAGVTIPARKLVVVGVRHELRTAA